MAADFRVFGARNVSRPLSVSWDIKHRPMRRQRMSTSTHLLSDTRTTSIPRGPKP